MEQQQRSMKIVESGQVLANPFICLSRELTYVAFRYASIHFVPKSKRQPMLLNHQTILSVVKECPSYSVNPRTIL
jgi:hypothetical protein